MINSSRFIEGFLQKQRFKKVIPLLKGDVLDFGGNEGELREYIKGDYTVVNYDHAPMEGKTFDTIVALAVIEHIEIADVFSIFHKFKSKLNPGGQIFLTTPTKMAKPVLEFMAAIKIVDKENIEEHKHYWNRAEIHDLAHKNGFRVKKYKKFQIGFNQYALFEHAS
jgi:2-polyprenyl-3-methyl-5-hydroxy-6-metoxy-1,4-benzoquinol methylase